MAYSKTTPAQVFLQLAVGGGLTYVLWQSIGKDAKEGFFPRPRELEKPVYTQAALDEELRKTSGKLWGIEGQDKDESGSNKA